MGILRQRGRTVVSGLYSHRPARSERSQRLCSNSVSSLAHRTACRSGQDSRLTSCDDGTLQTRTGPPTLITRTTHSPSEGSVTGSDARTPLAFDRILTKRTTSGGDGSVPTGII